MTASLKLPSFSVKANVGYVVIPNAGIDPEVLREIKWTVLERGLYVVSITKFAVHLRVWHARNS